MPFLVDGEGFGRSVGKRLTFSEDFRQRGDDGDDGDGDGDGGSCSGTDGAGCRGC